MIAQMDENHEGSIDQHEFLRYMLDKMGLVDVEAMDRIEAMCAPTPPIVAQRAGDQRHVHVNTTCCTSDLCHITAATLVAMAYQHCSRWQV